MESDLLSKVTASGSKFAHIYPGARVKIGQEIVEIGTFWGLYENRIKAKLSDGKEILLFYETFGIGWTMEFQFVKSQLGFESKTGILTFVSGPSEAILFAYRTFKTDIFIKFMKFQDIIPPTKKLERFLCAHSGNNEYLKNVIDTKYKGNTEKKLCGDCKNRNIDASVKYHSCVFSGFDFMPVVHACLGEAQPVIVSNTCIVLISRCLREDYPTLVIVRPDSIEIDDINNEICTLPLSRLLVWSMLLNKWNWYLGDIFNKHFRQVLVTELKQHRLFFGDNAMPIQDIVQCFETDVCICCTKPMSYKPGYDFSHMCQCRHMQRYEYNLHLMLLGILQNGWDGEIDIRGTGVVKYGSSEYKIKYEGCGDNTVKFNNARHGSGTCHVIDVFLKEMKGHYQDLTDNSDGSDDSDSDDS
jgi:hypothetical protein